MTVADRDSSCMLQKGLEQLVGSERSTTHRPISYLQLHNRQVWRAVAKRYVLVVLCCSECSCTDKVRDINACGLREHYVRTMYAVK
jgi:hypothetical protein